MIAFRLSNTRRTCTSNAPSTNCPVAGSSGIWPETYTVEPTLTACEYVPIAAGALGVEMIVRAIGVCEVVEEDCENAAPGRSVQLVASAIARITVRRSRF